jgi:hypothetical protein
VDPQWLEDYRQACGEITVLYGEAFGCLSDELGITNALELAPLLLPRVVAAAEQTAMEMREERINRELLQRQAEQQPQRVVVDELPENPW